MSALKDSQHGPGPRWLGEQPRKRYNIVLDPSVKSEGESAAKAEGLSFSMWMENAAKRALEKVKKEK
jgi:hypothetical protein